jgi:hypothetical protein
MEEQQVNTALDITTNEPPARRAWVKPTLESLSLHETYLDKGSTSDGGIFS